MRLYVGAVLAAAVLAGGACSAQPAGQNPTSFMAQNALAEGVKSLPSGVQYKVVSSGPADGMHPTPEDNVTVSYEGSLLSGKVFDATKDGKPATFKLGGLIPGWIDALQQMRPGDTWILYIPPSMGYGSQQTGPIPANSVLVFRLKLEAVGGITGVNTAENPDG